MKVKNTAYWKDKYNSPIPFDNTIDNSIGQEKEQDNNEKLIQALKRQDEVDKEVDKLKEDKEGVSNINPKVNI
tara:strand:+ start:420 stop:638 length:219 start_codon:yes stop_codon:yes gene_type:complete